MKKLLRLIAVAIMGVSLTTGMVAAQTAEVEETGPNSVVTIDFQDEYEIEIENETDVDLDFDNDQEAKSGDAVVNNNTTGEDARTGTASNNHTVMVEGEIDNTNANSAFSGWDMGEKSATVSNTGPNSKVEIEFNNEFEYEVKNETNLDVNVDNKQEAKSGNATVNNNTTGGGATTGNTSNTSSTTVNFIVRN